MKNLLILLTLLISFGNLHAQSDDFDGAILLGGYFNFTIQKKQVPYLGTTLGIQGASYSSRPTDARSTDLSISPIFGKEFSQHWALGVKLNYRNSTYKSETTPTFGDFTLFVYAKRTSHQIGTGFFARYTFNPEQKLNFFLQPYFDLNSATEVYKVDNDLRDNDKINYLQIGTNGGLLYNLNKKFRITATMAGLSFSTGKWKDLIADDMDNFFVFNTRIRVSSISFGIELKI